MLRSGFEELGKSWLRHIIVIISRTLSLVHIHFQHSLWLAGFLKRISNNQLQQYFLSYAVGSFSYKIYTVTLVFPARCRWEWNEKMRTHVTHAASGGIWVYAKLKPKAEGSLYFLPQRCYMYLVSLCLSFLLWCVQCISV